MNVEEILRKKIAEAFPVLFNHTVAQEEIQLQPTRQEFEGTFTFVIFPFARFTKKSPEEAGKILGEYLKNNLPEIASYNVVKGFLNIALTDQTWIEVFQKRILETDFARPSKNGKRVMVEYSSPNTNKPLHLGHLRNNFLGYAVSEILKENGYDVVKVNLINDRGIHICKSMLAYQLYGNNETPESAGIKGDHLIGKYYVLFDKHYKEEINGLKAKGLKEEDAEKEAPMMKKAQEMLVKWEQGDQQVRELWARMNGWVYDGFNATYKMIGVNFDKFYYESDTYLLGKGIVEEGLKKNAFYKKPDGSVWVDLTSDGLDQKLLLRSDGTSVYITQDLGTAELKYNEYKSDTSIYVVGDEQDYHFKVLKLILKKLEKPYAEGIYHLSYGMVDLPSGKMKSREGTVVDADQLIDEMLQTAEERTKELGKIEGFTDDQAKQLYKQLALGALKYFLLKVDPKKRMLFNPEESIEFTGHTGTFIQFTHARIFAILRKAKQLGINPGIDNISKRKSLFPTERQVIILLNDFPKILKTAADEYSPAVIAQYTYDLSKAYSSFYNEVPVFNEEDKSALEFRVAFSEAVAKTIKRAMGLLGIEVPERM